MPRDASDYIVSAILCLLAILGYLGFTGEQKERLEREMSYHQENWERARDVNKQLGCLKDSYLEMYVVDGELETGRAEKNFVECVK